MPPLRPSETLTSVHDNNIYAYTVQCSNQRIVPHTEFKNGTVVEYTDVIFSGVVAHLFRHALEGNILFDIVEVDLAEIVNPNAEVFAEGKPFDWPHLEYRNNEDLIAALHARCVKGYDIGSSYGLGGWVLAVTMDLLSRPNRAILEMEQT